MSAIDVNQRVRLIGSKLTGTTRHRWSANKAHGSKPAVKLSVKWDTGSLGTVNEEDLELFTENMSHS